MTERSYGEQRVSVELTNICNLHCSYCLRDEDALYHSPARFFPIPLLSKIAREGRDAVGLAHISFTGGEPSLHPQFAEAIATIAREGLTTSFVTNGWHFDRVWPAIAAHRKSLSHVSFSLDGATREAHDRWRGEGSFVRLVQAFSRCHHYEFPFEIKVVLRKDTLPQLEPIAIFAARMGASALNLGHLLPTSEEFDRELGLTRAERTIAEQEIAMLSRMLKMPIRLDVGYYNLNAAAPCSPLAGRSGNIDYRGRLSLCCNLSGYRGEMNQADVVADLNEEGYGPAFARLKNLAETQLMRRARALDDYAQSNVKPGLELGSPCLYCLDTFHKVPWQPSSERVGRSLPVMQASVR